MCSTPEGIGAGITSSTRRRQNEPLCAQRPKASERELLLDGSQPPIVQCQQVLNARRHRSGNYLPLGKNAEGVPVCSTPEGIGAGITMQTATQMATERAGAQRPKASERELLRRHDLEEQIEREVLNARRHRSGNYRSRRARPSRSSGAQRPKASERELLALQRDALARGSVLNARRHRSGNYTPRETRGHRRLHVLNARRHRSGNYPLTLKVNGAKSHECSTPEGIGAGITSRVLLGLVLRVVLNARRHRSGNYGDGLISIKARCCSAQRPKASERELLGDTWRIAGVTQCSTPEGIGAGITGVPYSANPHNKVLNARRHRSGNYGAGALGRDEVGECSTPEGIGAGITRPARHPSRRARGAQRPKASERELHSVREPNANRIVAVLNARRHRSGNYNCRLAPAAAKHQKCSTPEGIGAGITHDGIPRTTPWSTRAQRPKASERELPSSSGGPGRGSLRVLNARRHRSGNYSRQSCDFHQACSGAQRPKASERELPTRGGAFRGKRACAQRPKASERELPVARSR